MPDDNMPPPPAGAGQNPLPPPPPGQPPAKRIAVPANAVPAPHTALPRTIHIVIVGEITSYEADYMEVWKRYSGYDVKVWKDDNSIFDRIVFKTLVEDVYGKLTPKDLLLFDDKPDGPLAHFRVELEKIDGQIDAIKQSRHLQNRSEAVKIFLEDNQYFKLPQDKLAAVKTEIKKVKTEQSAIDARLRGKKIDVNDIDQLFHSPVNPGHQSDTYKELAYRENDPLLAERLARLWVLQDEGGITLDKRALPELNRTIFASGAVKAELAKIPVSDQPLATRAMVQEALKTIASTEPNWGHTTTPPGTNGVPDYMSELGQKYPTAKTAIRDAIGQAHAAGTPLFERLETIARNSNPVLLGDSPDNLAAKPLAVGALPLTPGGTNPPSVRSPLRDVEMEFYDIRSILDQRKRNAKFKFKDAVNQFIKTVEGRALGGRAMDEVDATTLRSAIQNFSARGVLPETDIFGDLLGHNAYLRHGFATKDLELEGGKLSGYSLHSDEFADGGFDLGKLTGRYKTAPNYDHKVLVSLERTPGALLGDTLLYLKDPERTHWVVWDGDKLVSMAGVPHDVTSKTKIVLSGHGSDQQGSRTLGELTPEQLGEEILTKLVPKGGKVRKVSFCGCNLEEPSIFVEADLTDRNALERSFSGRLLRVLEGLGIEVGTISASNKSTKIGAFAHRLYSFVAGEQKVTLRSPPDITVVETKLESGQLKARFKKGQQALPTKDYYLEQSDRRPDADLQGKVPLSRKNIDRLAEELYRSSRHILVPADTDAITVAMSREDIQGKIVVADEKGERVEGVKSALFLARRARNRDKWIEDVKKYYPEAGKNLEEGLSRFADPEEAFKRLKKVYSDGHFDFFKGYDPVRDAAVINGKYGSRFRVLRTNAIGVTCAGPNSLFAVLIECNPEEIEQEAENALSGLTLLSDDETQILIGDDLKDIALHGTSGNPVLEKVKQGLHTFRRNMAAQHLRNHEGYHNVIALDEDSLPIAQDIAEASGEKGRALLFDREHGVLLDEGRVVVMVEGGARNRMSLVGNKGTLDEFTGAELAEQVKTFARDGSVGSVTVQPVLETAEEAEEFNSGKTFNDLEVLVEKPGEDSPWKDVTGYVRLHPLTPDDMGEPMESDVLRVGVPGKPNGMELDNGYLKTALGLTEGKQPGAFESGLRDRLATIRARAARSESKTFQSLTLDYAQKVQELHAEVAVFRAAMDQVYADHAPGSDSHVTLSPDDMPILSSLAEKGDHWEITFANQDADSSSYKYVPIDDERIVDFIHSYSDKIDQVRGALDINLNGEDPTEGAEMIDGMGLAMALQSIIEQAGHHKEKVNDGAALPASYKRALQVHQVVGYAFGARASIGTFLDVAKYAIALKTGKVISLPERLSSRVASLSEELSGSVGESLKLDADSLKLVGPIFDGALTFASIGLDIAEIITSPTKEGKELAGLQLGLDTSLAAVTFTGLGIGTFGVAAGLSEVAVATISGSLGAITVPLAGLAIGIEALAQNFIVIEKEFDASMNFWEGVYQDLVLSDAFDKENGVLNLASRILKKDGKLVLDKNHKPQQTGRLAPISHIDFKTGKITYGNIHVPKVTGGHGNPITGYFLDGPDEWSDNGNINLVDNSNCRVRQYLEQGRLLPLDGLKAVILPARNDWSVRTDNNWVKQNPPGAVTWYLRHKDNHGYWLLKSREHKNCGGKSATGDFASSFWVAFIIIPTEWGMSLYFDSEHPKDFLKNNFQFDGHGKPTISALMPAHNLTVVAPTHEVHYNLTGTDDYRFYLSLPKNGTVSIHSSGQDHWWVANNQTKTLANGAPNLHMDWTSTPPVLKWPGNTVSLYNLKTNLTVYNSDDKAPVNLYIIDPVANRTVVLPNPFGIINPNHPSESTALESEYQHQNETGAVPRFYRYGVHGDWLDLKPPNHPNGTDLYMPDYFEGLIRKDQILKPGLFGEIYKADTNAAFSNLANIRALIGREPDLTFVGSELGYQSAIEAGSYHIPVSDLQKFLGEADIKSLDGSLEQTTLLQKLVFKLSGNIQLSSGGHTFTVTSEGCYELKIDYQSIVDNDRCLNDRAPSHKSGHFTASANALYDFELLYGADSLGHIDKNNILNSRAYSFTLQVKLDSNKHFLDADHLFNSQRTSISSPKLPKDTRPIAGWPDYGYMLYSNNTKSFFYRQPLNNSTNKADAHILKLPREYSGANFDPNSNFTAAHPQPFVLSSNGHIQYLLSINPNHTEPITHQPSLTPLEMIWKTAKYYMSAVQEILSEAFPHDDIIPAAVLPDNKNATKPCTYGFFDPGGSEGKGRVAVLDPGDHEDVQLKYAEVGSKAYNDGQLLNQTGCFGFNNKTNSSEALGYQPVHVVRNGVNDFYISFLQSLNQLYLANTTSGSTNTLQSSELLPLDLLLHNDTVNVTHAYMNSNRDGLVATTAHGVILDITDAALRNSTQIQPNPCVMLHEAVGNEYKIIGFIKGELEGWNLDAMKMQSQSVLIQASLNSIFTYVLWTYTSLLATTKRGFGKPSKRSKNINQNALLLRRLVGLNTFSLLDVPKQNCLSLLPIRLTSKNLQVLLVD